MLSRLLVVLYFIFGVSFAVALSSTSQVIVCVPGQCLQGFSDVSLGETLSDQGDTSAKLLPGQYTSTTSPQLLHVMLTSASASLAISSGFNSTSVILPLNIVLQPGIAMYSNSFYGGQPAFSSLPSTPINSSIPLPANSLALPNNVWAALTSGSSRIIFWDSVPDVSQLPPAISLPIALVDIQSSRCSPPCSSSTVCNASAICECPRGFTGSACESCADGFFGPTCQPCPSQCKTCDQGTSGSGRCIAPLVGNAPATCNCLNGLCHTTANTTANPTANLTAHPTTNATCTCNPGWTKAANGTACAQCAPGFYLTSTGDCQKCQNGCAHCADGTGNCITCENLFSQNENDSTKCDSMTAVTTTGTPCPDGSYSAGEECALCSQSCTTCNGPSEENCIVCGSGLSKFHGKCVAVGADGVCAGTGGMIADNNKLECDACGAKCMSCKIPNFSVASIASQRQCISCLPGSFLSNGSCLENCPSGTFVSPKDNLTCTACSSSCGTCLGSADYCLTCTNQQLASSGQCVSACPAGTFSASGACVKCHPDCQSCTGESFDQCATCRPTRPVFSSGRCLPTCGQSEFFDVSTSTCQNCDSSCSSCLGSGSSNCLACSSSNQVLRAGSCVPADCAGSTSVIPNFGVCLSDLVQVPNSTSTSAAAATPTISRTSSSSSVPKPSGGATPPIVVDNGRLLWWQILLMVLGGIFFIILILVLWRKLARNRRAEETVMFASARQIDGTDGWGWRLKQIKDILFGGKKGGYDVYDYPPMTSYGYGESLSHQGSVGRNLDIDLPNPMTDYLDDALSTFSIPRSIQHRPSTGSKQYPSTKRRRGSRRSARGYRSNDPSPTRDYHSDILSPTKEYHSDIRSPTGRHRSYTRSPMRRHRSNNRSPTRRYRSDDPYPLEKRSSTRKNRSDDPSSPARLYYLSDDPYPSEKHSSTRKSRLDDPYPLEKRPSTRKSRLDDPYPLEKRPSTRKIRLDDPYPLEKRPSTRKNRSDDPSPARLYYLSDDPYPPEKLSSPRKSRSDDLSPERLYYLSDNRSPTRESTREYPSFGRSMTNEYPPDIRSPMSPYLKDRWEDRIDNSLSRYPRKEKPPPSQHFMSPPPSYPAHSDRGNASKY